MSEKKICYYERLGVEKSATVEESSCNQKVEVIHAPSRRDSAYPQKHLRAKVQELDAKRTEKHPSDQNRNF